MRVISFSWYLVKTCAAPPLPPPCLFLTARKRLPFHTYTFPRPAYLTDIIHNNHHISRHRYNCNAGALPVYLDIGDKCLLVNITQAFRFFPKICSARMSWIWLGYQSRLFTHQFYQDSIARPSF